MNLAKCAYCGWKIPVNSRGYLQAHYSPSERCLGSGFPRSTMVRLRGDLAETKLRALDNLPSLKERIVDGART